MKVRLVNPITKVTEERKVGFSWTSFFFGFFVPLFRGDWKWSLIMMAAAFCTMGFSGIVFCFIYNGINIKEMLAKGYLPADEESKQALLTKGYIGSGVDIYKT